MVLPMNTVTVYRLQHPKTRCGPWHSCYTGLVLGIGKVADLLDSHFYNHPEYWEAHRPVRLDFDYWEDRFKCAAPSLEILRDWFAFSPRIVRELTRTGFTVLKITVREDKLLLSKSGRQVGIDLTEAEGVEDVSIRALVE